MTTWQKKQLYRVCVYVLASISVVACSDRKSGNEEIVDEGAARISSEWLAVADSATGPVIERGERVFQMCAGCHGIDEGEFSPAGPSLYNIAGRTVGSLDAYPYTQALVGKAESWTVARFDEFIGSPQDVYPGNGMAYTGLKNSEDRAALIAYVATKSQP